MATISKRKIKIKEKYYHIVTKYDTTRRIFYIDLLPEMAVVLGRPRVEGPVHEKVEEEFDRLVDEFEHVTVKVEKVILMDLKATYQRIDGATTHYHQFSGDYIDSSAAEARNNKEGRIEMNFRYLVRWKADYGSRILYFNVNPTPQMLNPQGPISITIGEGINFGDGVKYFQKSDIRNPFVEIPWSQEVEDFMEKARLTLIENARNAAHFAGKEPTEIMALISSSIKALPFTTEAKDDKPQV